MEVRVLFWAPSTSKWLKSRIFNVFQTASATQGLEKMFRLSRRRGSTLWQVRKRWPSDVAAILRGEFTKSEGEADRKKAQAMLPLIASEYEARVQQVRDRRAGSRFRDLAEPEIARLTALFYARRSLPIESPARFPPQKRIRPSRRCRGE
ncbi:MAG TPA: hypothetical protein VM662_13130 [Sphingomonas sp.]|nr:hypothetical protein [Sphingomonas sp.]